MTTTVTARDSELPVTLQEAKEHLRFTDNVLDEHIQSLIAAATEYCESATGRSLRVNQTMVQTFADWPGSKFQFDREPVISIESIGYYDSNGDLQEVDDASYRLVKSRHAASKLEFDSTFTSPGLTTRQDAIVVTYLAGYESIKDVPADDPEPQILGVPALAKIAVKLKTSLLFGSLDVREIDSTERALADILRQLEWGAYR
jgi:uncharacterized phiE125 gp8 family phage protein